MANDDILLSRRSPGDAFLLDVIAELSDAQRLYKPYNSLHEVYAVILEEVDELWDECRKKGIARETTRIREELIQIAVTAWRAAIDLGLEGDAHA
jgi:hypothetical protein